MSQSCLRHHDLEAFLKLTQARPAQGSRWTDADTRMLCWSLPWLAFGTSVMNEKLLLPFNAGEQFLYCQESLHQALSASGELIPCGSQSAFSLFIQLILESSY